MVGLDVRDEHGCRRKVRERLVGLVGFHDVVTAGPGMGVRAIGAHDAADKERGVGAEHVERAGQHGRRGGFAVRAGNGKRVKADTEVREHLGAVPDLKAAALCLDKLGVVFENGRGHDDDGVARRDVLGFLADEDGDAGLAQLLGVAAVLDVGAGDFHALVVGHLRDAAHADAADADEVHLLDAFCAHVGCPLVYRAQARDARLRLSAYPGSRLRSVRPRSKTALFYPIALARRRPPHRLHLQATPPHRAFSPPRPPRPCACARLRPR